MSVTVKSRLLCPEGCGVKQVTEINGTIRLICGHSRSELLPTDRISIEHMFTRVGQRLFPAVRDQEMSSNRSWCEDWSLR